MLRFLKNSLLLCLLVTAFPVLWSAMTAHDDVFDERGVLRVDASRLKNTCVSPHLVAPITEGGNVLWCGTFQLAWNEVRTLIGEDLHFAGKEPEMVAVLNKRQFLKSDLDEASYVAVADFVRNDVHGRAYGLDLLLEKKRLDRWSGWVAVSYSRSERTNDRTGLASRYYLDTPIVANAVVSYQWRPSIELGARLTVRSGQPTTPIVGVVENPYFPGYVAAEYGVPYSERLPTYTRLDLRAKWSFSLYGIPSSLSLDIINVTNAKNVEARQLDYLKSVVGGPVYTKDYEGLPFFPALSLRMSF